MVSERSDEIKVDLPMPTCPMIMTREPLGIFRLRLLSIHDLEDLLTPDSGAVEEGSRGTSCTSSLSSMLPSSSSSIDSGEIIESSIEEDDDDESESRTEALLHETVVFVSSITLSSSPLDSSSTSMLD